MKPKPYVEHDPFEQPRHRCRVCGRVRYEKFMRAVDVAGVGIKPGRRWYCNTETAKCWQGEVAR